MSQLGKRPRPTSGSNEGNVSDSSNGSPSAGRQGHDNGKRQHKRARKGGPSPLKPQAPSSGDSKGKAPLQLPANFDVENGLSQHAREIHALHNAIRASAGGSSVRAWQMMPRHKRRRNASHNLLALPKRLRGKGRAEMRASTTEPQSRAEVRKKKGAKRGGTGMGAVKVRKGRLMQSRGSLGAYPRRREGKRRSLLVSRAMVAALHGKAWLETHLWHVKRFRMSGREGKVVAGERIDGPQRWGFSLPEETTTKSFRSSWRDNKKHVTLMDRSYESWFRISLARQAPSGAIAASRETVQEVLSTAGLVTFDLSKCVNKTVLSAPGSYDVQDAEASALVHSARAKCPVWIYCFVAEASKEKLRPAEVLIRTHPASASQVERALRRAIAIKVVDGKTRPDLLRLNKLNSVPHPLLSAGSGAIGRRHGKASQARKDQQRRRHMIAFDKAMQFRQQRMEAPNVFELSGPSAGILLSRVLRPVKSHANPVDMAALRLGKLRPGEALSLAVHDPRLSFPPRRAHSSKNVSPTTRKRQKKQMQDRKVHVDSGALTCTLFAEGTTPPKFTTGEIDHRRSKLPVPGARLLPTSRDDIVPVVVACEENDKGAYILSLFVPRGWGRAFWLSLAHSDTRVLGQLQHRALQFDTGKPTFPHDWAGTPAFENSEEHDTAQAFAVWKRTPPAKRVNPSKSGVRWPFGGEGAWVEVVRNGNLLLGASVDMSTDKVPSIASVIAPKAMQPWPFLDAPRLSIDNLIAVYRDWLIAHQQDEVSPLPAVLRLCSDALVSVKITACRRGNFEKWDEIHFLPAKEAETWRRALLNVQADKYARDQVQLLEQAGLRSARNKQASSTHIGTVTTGNFSLSNGKGTAIASISLMAYLLIVTRDLQLSACDDGTNDDTENPSRNPIVMTNLVVVRSVRGAGSVRAASLKTIPLVT